MIFWIKAFFCATTLSWATPTPTATPTEFTIPYVTANIHAVADDTVSIYINGNFVGGQTFDRTPTPVAITLNSGWNEIDYYVYNGLASAHLRTVPSWSGLGTDFQPAKTTPGPGTQETWLHEYRGGVIQDTNTYLPDPSDLQTPTLIGTVTNSSLAATYNFASPNELHHFGARVFVPTVTATTTPTLTETLTFTESPTPTSTPTASATPTTSPTLSMTETSTPTDSPTFTATETPTSSPTASPISTETPTVTHTFTFTVTPTATQSRTPAYLNSPFGKPVIGPVPIKRGQRSCLYFDAAPKASKWEVFNTAGERVARLTFGSETHHCWNGISVAPGLYWVVADIFYVDGIHSVSRQKLIILP